MSPDFDDTQAMSSQAPSQYGGVQTMEPVGFPSMIADPAPGGSVAAQEQDLPSMEDLDSLVTELDEIDTVLAELR